MRIGVFDPYLDDLGGGEKYMMSLALYLAQTHQVDIFWDNPEDVKVLSQRFGMDMSKVHIAPNLFRKTVTLLQRFFLTKKYDAIFFLSDGSIPLVASKKLFIHAQQPLEVLQHAGFFDWIKLRRVTRFFCNSGYTQSFIQKKFRIESTIIYPPVSIQSRQVKKENTILNVGRFRVKNVANGDYKKQGFMVETFKQMVDNGLKNWNFVLAVSVKNEEQDIFSKLQQHAKGYPISFLVNKTNDELWDSYSKAKIYWHASGFGEDLQKHPEYAEHFGISTVEAMGAGAVPIVINAGGQKEIIKNKENGLLWNTKEEMEEYTKEVMRDTKMWEKLSENARTRARDFSPESFSKSVYALLSK